jgi:hypothetical protein
MSMNLAFEKPNGEYVDFPFQTPTKLTREVIAEPSNIEKLRLIKEYLEEEDWIEEEENVEKDDEEEEEEEDEVEVEDDEDGNEE